MDQAEHVAHFLDRLDTARIKRVRENLRHSAGEIEESARELEASITELHREPTARVDLSEEELVAVVEYIAPPCGGPPELHTARAKLSQALRVERGPGGAFDGGEAA